jgi:hypothetical protein
MQSRSLLISLVAVPVHIVMASHIPQRTAPHKGSIWLL